MVADGIPQEVTEQFCGTLDIFVPECLHQFFLSAGIESIGEQLHHSILKYPGYFRIGNLQCCLLTSDSRISQR